MAQTGSEPNDKDKDQNRDHPKHDASDLPTEPKIFSMSRHCTIEVIGNPASECVSGHWCLLVASVARCCLPLGQIELMVPSVFVLIVHSQYVSKCLEEFNNESDNK